MYDEFRMSEHDYQYVYTMMIHDPHICERIASFTSKHEQLSPLSESFYELSIIQFCR